MSLAIHKRSMRMRESRTNISAIFICSSFAPGEIRAQHHNITYFFGNAKLGPPKSDLPFVKCHNFVSHRLPSSYAHVKEFWDLVK